MIHSPSLKASYEATLTDNLRTNRFGRERRFFHVLGSTNTEALTWAAQGAPEGALVLAEFQTSGRGRHGRSWSAEESRNLLFSIVLRPAMAASRWGQINVAASLAIVETIDEFITPLKASIKWPNDILINGKKCCGMLTETVTSGQLNDVDTPLILGIGINVNQISFPTDIETQATSLLLEAGRHVPRAEMLARLLNALELRYDAVQSDQNPDSFKSYEAHMAYLNQKSRLRFTGKTESIEGVIRGITPMGVLRFETNEGEQLFHAGEVTTHRVAASQEGLS